MELNKDNERVKKISNKCRCLPKADVTPASVGHNQLL